MERCGAGDAEDLHGAAVHDAHRIVKNCWLVDNESIDADTLLYSGCTLLRSCTVIGCVIVMG